MRAAQNKVRTARRRTVRGTTMASIQRSMPMRGPPASQRSGIGEVKALDISNLTAAPGGAALNFNATGSIIPLNLVQAGSSFFNRIGRKIEMKSIDLTMQANPLTVTRAAGADYVRVAVVYDRQTNGAIPSLQDIFQNTEQSGTNTTSSLAGVNLNNRDRFSIIIDKRIQLPAVTLTAGVPTNVWPNSFGAATGDSVGVGAMREFRALKGLLTHYKADSNPAVIGDISTGALYLITFATETAGTEGFFGADWNVRLRYTDV